MQKFDKLVRFSVAAALSLMSACSMDIGRLQLNGETEPLPADYRAQISGRLHSEDWTEVSDGKALVGANVFAQQRPYVCVLHRGAANAFIFEAGRIAHAMSPADSAALCPVE